MSIFYKRNAFKSLLRNLHNYKLSIKNFFSWAKTLKFSDFWIILLQNLIIFDLFFYYSFRILSFDKIERTIFCTMPIF